VLEWLTNTDYAVWVRQSWGWALALTFHAFGTAMVVGLIFIIALRLLGFFRTIPYTSLNKLLPVIWIGVIIQVLSGGTLWVSKPARYLADGMFQFKFAFVVASVIVTIYFQQILNRETPVWQSAGLPAVKGNTRVLVAVTTLLWAAVLVAGRLTAYLGQLYHA
jgi:hypothetical protein